MELKGLIVIGCLSLAVGALGATLPKTVGGWRESKARFERKLAEIETLRKEKERLAAKVEALKNDPAVQELTLRRFGYAKKGETVFLILRKEELEALARKGEEGYETPSILQKLSAKLREGKGSEF